MYSSRATELGRGPKLGKLSDAPDWTPGPGSYNLKSDFVNQRQAEEEKLKATTQQMGGTTQSEEAELPLQQEGTD